MKKAVCIILALVMCLSLCACGGTGNEGYDYIISLLDKGEYDMAINVIEGMRDNNPGGGQEGQMPGVQDTPSGDQEFHATPNITGSDMIFHMDVINMSGRKLILQTVLIVDWKDGMELGTSGFEGPDLERLGLAGLELEANAGRGWDDAYPVTQDFDRRDYLFVFADEQGEMVRYRYIFEWNSNDLPAPADMNLNQPESEINMSFSMMLENTGDTPWEMTSMDITDLMDGQQLGAYIFEGEDLGRLNFESLIIQPGEKMLWNDGHPLVQEWNGREYRFHFVDGNGEKHTLNFLFDNLHEKYAPVDYSADSGKDLKALRYDADFKQEVYEGVYWMPASALGESRYSNQQVYDMLSASPEVKRDKISTLYEALQLYQVGNFKASDDNMWEFENGINWEHHKPGYHAVRTNTGCCATDSNWLRYILDGDYDEVGFIATSQRDASGHVYNYILSDGWYYFIDLTHYRAADALSAVEDGDINSYYASAYILGNIHAVQDIQDYVDYIQSESMDPPGLMFVYTAENVLAVCGDYGPTSAQIIYEEANGQKIDVVFDDPSDSLTYTRATSPVNIPDWSALPDGVFG